MIQVNLCRVFNTMPTLVIDGQSWRQWERDIIVAMFFFFFLRTMLQICAVLTSFSACQLVSSPCRWRLWRDTALKDSQSMTKLGSVDDRILTPSFRS